MKVEQFRFFRSDDPYDNTPHWSRCYEWKYALDVIRADQSLQFIHNACCGPELIHKFFHDRLIEAGRSVVNTDLVKTPINADFRGFHTYNILDSYPGKFDCVMCISAIEKLGEEKLVRSAFSNLIEQIAPGGRLVITCDYPGVKLELLEELVGAKCSRDGKLLSGLTSAYSDRRFADLNVVLLDIRP